MLLERSSSDMAAASMSLVFGTGGAGVTEGCFGVGGNKWRRGAGHGLRRADRLAVQAGDDGSGRHARGRRRAAADRTDDQGARAHRGDRVRDGQAGVVGVAALALPIPGAVAAEAVTAEAADV